jgi:PAS domain S-box-containing protein
MMILFNKKVKNIFKHKIMINQKKYFILLFILFSIHLNSKCNNPADSEIQQKPTIESIKFLNDKAILLAETYSNISLKYSLLAYEYSKQLNLSKLQQLSVKNIAIAHKNMGNNTEALTYYKINLDLCKVNKDISSEIETLNEIGELNRLIGLLELSIEYHLNSLDLAKKYQIINLIPTIYNSLGVTYRNIGDAKKARDYYDKALTFGLNQNNYVSITKSYENIGNLYWYNHLYDSSLVNYNKALYNSINIKQNQLTIKIGLLNNIGNAYRGKKEFRKALNYYDSALFINKSIKNKNLEAVVLKNIGNTFFDKGNASVAIHYINKSNLIAKEIYLKRILIENHFQLSEIYSKTGNYKFALDNYKIYIQHKDSVFLNEKNYKISELELKYKNKENEETINQLKYNKQKNNLLYTSIIAIVSFLLLIVTYNRYRLKKQDNKKIEEQGNHLKMLNEELKKQYELLKSNKEELTNSETLFRTIFETSPLGKILLDSKGNILKINNSFLKIVGFDVSRELIGLNITQLAVLKRTRVLVSFSDVIENKQVVFGDTTIRNSKGECVVINYHLFPILNENGELIKIQALATDITEKQKSEKALIKSERQLRELNATKDKFFSIIAHDIKNPFNAIMGFSHLLNEDYELFTDEERKQFVGNISQASEDVYNLLENLLKWSWTQNGQISYNPKNLDLKEICSETIAVLNLQAERKSIKIECSINESIFVFADENMLKTVFRNLISNAIKFTNENGFIKINHFIFEKKQDNSLLKYIQIQVKDNGVGISQEDLKKLFRIDEKINSKGTIGETGTGLGLILCKEFIVKNKGKIWVESELGEGSNFNFTIPIE